AGMALRPADVDPRAWVLGKSATMPHVSGVQVDFDAVESERPFYRDLLTRLRPKLPPTTSLSIPALASWCAADAWLDGLPIDEAVPLLFRISPADATLPPIA